MNWLNYLLQVNLYLVLFYGFYRLLLRSETFFNLNRGYLVASAALAFFIPLMQSDWVRSWFVTEQVSQTISTLYDPQIMYIQASASQVHTMTMGEIMAFCYIIGIMLGIARFGGNLVFLGQMMKQKTQGESSKRAFSFFNVLFVSKELKNRSTIMKHEFVHIRQLHSADVMLFELIAIFNWFNPVVYLYKSSIKHIHEFIADEVASRNEASKAEYAMLLFQEQFGVQAIPLTNNFFNQSLLKLRIKMLHKSRSTETALMKYGLIAPLFMLMIVVSSATLATKPIQKIEEIVKEVSAKDAPIINDKTVVEAVTENNPADPNLDLSKAYVISPALVDEVRNYGKKDTTVVFNTVEQNAEYPGGMAAFGKYLQENLKYPEAAQKANYSGKVYIQFIVNTDGSANDFEVLKSAEYGCSEEALRVLKTIPKWVAGEQSGRKVRSRFTIPISFQLEKETKVKIDEKEKNEFPKLPAVIEFKGNKGEIFSTNVVMNNKCKDCPPPLCIVDGVESQSDILKNLNPNDIQSIDIVKGEKATLIYGEKGKNGVILITSKKK
ncbi:MAG: TonB family protein [Arcicella sp.]|nr:TonB family protein [Arcicella sp.]